MMIEELRKKAQEMQAEILKKDNENEKEKINSVIDFLKSNTCFNQVEANVGYNILLYLGYPQDNIFDVYSCLIAESLGGDVTFKSSK